MAKMLEGIGIHRVPGRVEPGGSIHTISNSIARACHQGQNGGRQALDEGSPIGSDLKCKTGVENLDGPEMQILTLATS